MNPQAPNSPHESAGAQPNGQGAGQSTITSTAAPPTDWPPLIRLDEGPDLPSFPVDLLPGWLRGWSLAEAVATQTPHDLAAMLALTCSSAGIAGKIRVEIRPNWEEPSNVYLLAALATGDRKSVVFGNATAPIEEFEREQQTSMAPDIARADAEHCVLADRLKHAQNKAAKETDQTARQLLLQEARDLASSLSAHRVPVSPRYLCADVTPEHLSQLLARHGARMFLASPEPTIFRVVTGRSSATANLDGILKAHTGDPIRVGRVERGQELVFRPALTVALAVQPDVLRGLAQNPALRERGFLARFAYCLPRSKVGERMIAAPPVPADVASTYRDRMLALWRLPAPTPAALGYVCHRLKFSPEADDVMRDFEGWLEPQLVPGAELSYLAGWPQKLAGLVGATVSHHAHGRQDRY